MSILGKFHEISFYSLISTIICLCTGKTTFAALWDAKLNVTSFSTFFLAFLFWACVLFIPIAIIGAFATKYGDGGEGLSFKSDNLFVIFFAHIAEEILGLFLTPFWFLIRETGPSALKNKRELFGSSARLNASRSLTEAGCGTPALIFHSGSS